jgi:hypothetical protein
MRSVMLDMSCNVDDKWSQVYVRVIDPDTGEILREWGDQATYTPLADLARRSFETARFLFGDNLSVFQQFWC